MSDEGEIRLLKLSFVRGIIYALEAAGLDQQRFMRSIGVRPMWMLEDAERSETPLEEYARIYNAAAEAAGWKSAAHIFRVAAMMQRFDEWPIVDTRGWGEND